MDENKKEEIVISKVKSKIVVVRMTSEMVDQLQALAYKNKTQKTKVITAIISNYFKSHPIDPLPKEIQPAQSN